MNPFRTVVLMGILTVTRIAVGRTPRSTQPR
jgi:hypothetical protein